MGYNLGFSDIHVVADDIKNKEAIVLYRDIGGIGDAVMITGAITGLRRELGKSIKIIVATIPYCAPVFFNNPDIDWIVDSSKFDRVHADGAIDYGSGKEICREYFERAGAMFVGLSHPCPSAVYEAFNEPDIQKSRQELFAEACGVKYNKGDCNLYVTDDEINQIKHAIPYENYFVFHVRSNSPARDLPKFHADTLAIELAKRLDNIGYGLVLLSHDWKYRLKRYKNIVNVISTPLRYVMAFVASSKLLIGVDSMGVHLAGGLGVPVYGIFGSTDPAMRLSGYNNSMWYSGYNRCKRKPCWYHPCIFRFCMKSISMEKVADDVFWFNNVINYVGRRK